MVPGSARVRHGASIMDLKQLRYFLAVAEELSFSRAAEILHKSQPPVSYQIKALEDEIGAKLFTRAGASIRLTAAGAELARDVSLLMSDLLKTVERVRSIAKDKSGHIRIGVNPSIMWTPFLKQLQRFMARRTELTWSLVEGSSEQLHSALKAGQIDLGLWRTPMLPGSGGKPLCVESVLLTEPLVALVSCANSLAKEGSIPLNRLAPYALLTLECDKSHFARGISEFCRKAGFEARIRESPVAAETLIAMAAADLGVALAPRSIASIAWPGVSVVRISPDAPCVAVHIAHAPAAAEAVGELAGYLMRHLCQREPPIIA